MFSFPQAELVDSREEVESACSHLEVSDVLQVPPESPPPPTHTPLCSTTPRFD